MGSRNGLSRNIMRVLTANFIHVFVGLISSFIFPRILSISSYAYFQSFILYLGYLNIIHLGFPSGLMVKYAGKDHNGIDKRQYKTEFLIITYIIAGFSILLLILAIALHIRMLMFLGVAIIPVIFTNTYKNLYQAWNKFELFTGISIFTTVFAPLVAILVYLITNQLSGETYICIFISAYTVAFIYVFRREVKMIRGQKRNAFISQENWTTEKVGFAILLGNYINLLFSSADKQFVNSFFSTKEFALYSFAISLQSIMTVFITSLSQPLFPALANGKVSDDDHNLIKEMLIIFGSFSGCAFFLVSIIVKKFITKYIGSIEIVNIYFAIFPAMAIVNCLYINLYKIKGKVRQYIKTLVIMLFLAILLDSLVVVSNIGFKWIALATVVVYYTWLIVGSRQFETIELSTKDIFYFICFFALFLGISRCFFDAIGFVIYFLINSLVLYLLYKKTLLTIFERIRSRRDENGGRNKENS